MSDLSVEAALGAAQDAGSAPDATDLVLAQVSKANPDAGFLATTGVVNSPEVRTAINKGAKIIKDAKPVIALAQIALSGKDPDPMALVAGMSGVIGMVNPLAGAVVFAMGSIMIGLETAANGLFTALGLRHDVPSNETVVGGIVVGRMPTPRPPVVNEAGDDISFDPLWVHWDKIVSIVPVATWDNFWYAQKLNSETDMSTAHLTVDWLPMAEILRVIAPKWPASTNYDKDFPGYAALCHHPYPYNDFERFFYPMLQKTLEHWYNANPHMDPRELLGMAVTAWNHLHTDATRRIYKPAEGKSDSIVSYLQSGRADCKRDGGSAQRGLDVTVNLGPMVSAPVAVHAAVVNRMAVRTGPMRAAFAPIVAAISRAAVVVKPAPPAPPKLPAPIERTLPAPIDKRPAPPSQWSIGETLVACGAVGGVAALVLSRD